MSDRKIKTIDLFAGIGGIRLGFETIGTECVYVSEWNKFSQKTYLANFSDPFPIDGDITLVDAKGIPDHDILLAGFPCQPFSLAGVSKKNSLGRATGFMDKTQGTLFFDIARIIKEKRPQAFMLENVKNLVSHEKGRTFRIILETLTDELGYHVMYKVIDGQNWVPQHRERIIIVGFREKTDFSFEQVNIPNEKPALESILHPEDGSEPAEEPYTTGESGMVNSKYVWRYDPILINEKYTEEYHIRAFTKIAEALKGCTTRVVISFVDLYAKTQRNTKDLHIKEIGQDEMRGIARKMAEIAHQNGMEIESCAELINLEDVGVKHGCCIDKNLIEQIIGCPLKGKKDKNQRPECGCFESVEIGTYNTCRNGCRYCYANYNQEQVINQSDLYDPDSPILCGLIDEKNGDKINVRKVESLKDSQISFL